ncbi:MAG: transcriptional repressor LexA, partial [Tumebacillaceae bacterium]
LDLDGEVSTGCEYSTVMAPVIGKVTAGQPITAIENVEEYFPLPANFVGDSSVFLLNVVGDSMIDAGILDRDMVIVRQQSHASNGEIVVAMTEEDEATVKRFYKESDHIRLQPENPNLEPMRYRNVTILGKVIGVFRNVH